MAKTGLPAHQLELELTESIFIKDSDPLVELLNHFRQMGIRLALDDFGTGYSSLSYLSRLPVDTLKIDQSFTRRMNTQADIKSIVQAIVAMAKTLNLQITAEGVETHDHLQLVAQMECDEAQGYLFSRPISPVAMSRFLQQPMPSFLAPNPNGRIHVIMPDISATRRPTQTAGMNPIKIVDPSPAKPSGVAEPTRKMKQTLPVPADQIWRSQPTQQMTKIEVGEQPKVESKVKQ
ncbi:MAG: EAL domain-containing protein [Synechococcaceae cyanobacterium SM2_3_2]|nr:EAL domain-containing protein [Synechococcaceae cyanobacterium SM2_3_2]